MLLVSNIFLGQDYKDGFSDGKLIFKGSNIPVKIFSSPRLQDITDILSRKEDNILIILNKNNVETYNQEEIDYLVDYYQHVSNNNILTLDKNLMPIKKVTNINLKNIKYLLKTSQNINFNIHKYIYLDTEFKIWDPKEGIDIFGFNLRYYGLMFMLAFGLGLLIMKKIFRIDEVDEKYLDPLFTYTLFGTIFGARIGHVLFYEPHLFINDFWSVFLPIRTNPSIEFTGFSGLASHGATIALILTTLYYSKKIINKNPFWVYDRLGIVIAIGGAFVRLGNFFNSEIIGKPVEPNSPFAVLFPQQSLDYGTIVPRYPTQLFEAFGYFCLFILLILIYRFTNKKYQQGWLFGLFFVILWGIRFFVEFFKEPQGDEVISFLGLNTGHILSIPFMLAGFVIMIYSSKMKIDSSLRSE